MKKLIITVLVIFTSLTSFAFCGSDIIISYTVDTQSRECTSHGYCTMYDTNPETGAYENFYGFHAACKGTEEKRTDKYLCQRDDFTTYEDNVEGMWGTCNITL